MKKHVCAKCGKLFYYDPKSIPSKEIIDQAMGAVLHYKVMSCPYCRTAMILSKRYEWFGG